VPDRNATSLEDQLAILRSCGIRLAPGVEPSALTRWISASEFEADPFRLALVTMGNALSDDIWHFDTECIEGDGAYTSIAKRLVTLARDDLPLESIEDHVDIDEGNAWIQFHLDGEQHHWIAAVQDDWVDPAILSRFASLLAQRSANGRRFTYIDLGGQDCLIGCATAEQKAKLQEHTGLKVDWLT